MKGIYILAIAIRIIRSVIYFRNPSCQRDIHTRYSHQKDESAMCFVEESVALKGYTYPL